VALRSELTPREIEILNLIILGLTDKEIGQRLSVSSKTVQQHLRLVYTKLRVHNRTSAVIKAVKAGYIKLKKEDKNVEV